MSKILSKKLLYIIAVLAVLAMMIPMSIPVSAAAGDHLIMTIGGVADSGYNVTDATVRVSAVATNGTTPVTNVDHWNIVDQVNPTTNSQVLLMAGDKSWIDVTGVWGETMITATLTDNTTIYASGTTAINKKWGQILYTDISAPGTSPVTWNEGSKEWTGTGSVTDTVYGDFIDKDGHHTTHPAQGVILNWYLVEGNLAIPMASGEAQDLKDYMSGLNMADFVDFVVGGQNVGTENVTTTDGNGASTIGLLAWGEENVQIVVVPEYPGDPQLNVTPEVTSWNFWTREMETVPQVRWVGEKIVLEKNFTEALSGRLVNFVITSGEGALEQFGEFPGNTGMNLTSNSVSVWTEVDSTGMASVILTADKANQVNVRAALYDTDDETMVNQHAFTVYFLKFEALYLSDVPGKRADHDAGIWTLPSNPYNANFPGPANLGNGDDVLAQDGNVSQDLLERAQVSGWFMGVNASVRDPLPQDTDGDGEPDVMLPAGRWVLPDDWGKLAGMNNWQERRIHWDIMDNPSDLIRATTPTGAYLPGQYTPVMGPFSPGIELMTPTGWELSNTSPDLARQMKTVVPDGNLDAWDAPMPPAKIIFEITDGNGSFKDTNKADIYILNNLYTNPFYEAMIPAHWAIPAFINNGGYDWDSFLNEGDAYGPYMFWTIINRPGMNAAVPSTDWSGHPTKVEVYSDNHGEAMVYLNGNWNLDLLGKGFIGGKDGASIEEGAEVGTTTVQAMADYPYVRTEQPITSNEVEKTWFWGGNILGIDNATYNNGGSSASSLMVLAAGQFTLTGGDAPADNAVTGVGYSDDYVAFVWAADRDGMQEGMLGTRIDWVVNSSGNVAKFGTIAVNHTKISTYNLITKDIYLDVGGFLSGTMGMITNPDGTMGTSYMRAPTASEKLLFLKKWPGLDPDNYAVAAIDVFSSTDVDATIDVFMTGPDFGYPGHPIGEVYHTINVIFGDSYPLDDPIRPGDANLDGVVNAADITSVERIIVGMDARNVNADTSSNGSIDMGDVVKITRIILGLN